MDKQRDGAAIWALLIPVICCGGLALWLLIAGTGIAGAGALGASTWLLILGLAVVVISVFWWTRRRV